MNPENIKKMVTAALFAAIVCISTLIVLTYSATGYIHLGDCFVLVAGWVLGPFWGALAAAVGSMLTDLILGFAVYMPATLIIKGLMAAAAFWVMSLIRGGRAAGILKYIISALIAELKMVGGYFIYEVFLYETPGALANVVPNLIQGLSGIVLAPLIIHPLMRVRYLGEMSGRE